jgi:phosphate transport system protein
LSGRAHFDEALDALRVDVGALGGMAEDAVRDSAAALVGDRPELAERVIAGDDEIDRLFVALEERAYQLVAQQAPVAHDLRFLMAVLRVISDYEKTGDRAVSVAKVAIAEWEREPHSLTLLGRMADLSIELLVQSRRAWTGQDLVRARQLKARDDVLDDCYRRLVRHLLDQGSPGASGLVLYAHSAGRHFERIADHAVIVGERVAYLLTGDPGALAAEVR